MLLEFFICFTGLFVIYVHGRIIKSSLIKSDLYLILSNPLEEEILFSNLTQDNCMQGFKYWQFRKNFTIVVVS